MPVELHFEQGPILEAERQPIGAVENLQCISWQKLTIGGTDRHPWIGLVPQQDGSGGKVHLGRISGKGEPYLRSPAENQRDLSRTLPRDNRIPQRVGRLDLDRQRRRYLYLVGIA